MNYESDGRVPNSILIRAADKLHLYGQDIFDMFCNEHDISFADRNRAIAKCKVLYQRSDLREMPCPDNLIGQRWQFYTRQLKYSTEKATKMLALIDKAIGAAHDQTVART